jgi:hypothetical protein
MAEDHRYNDPSLSPLSFLQAVYSDPSVSMFLRMKAAEVAAPYLTKPVFVQHEPWPGQPMITIRIEGISENTSVTVGSGQEPRTDAPGQEVVGHA